MDFLKDDKNFRPLLINHALYGFNYFTPNFIARQKSQKLVDKIIDYGYGGVVCNVPWGKKIKNRKYLYLKRKRYFKLMRIFLKVCKEKGIKVWIYDECGYPSGGALGQVVKKDPKTEAYGIINIDRPLKKGESTTICLPYGHEKVKAVLFKTQSGTEDLTHIADGDGTVNFTAPEDGTLYYIASKVLFEGVHPCRKFSLFSRYIDVMDKKAVSDFIKITYEQYKKYVGDFFGNTVEAVFTDEPSVLNRYYPNIERNPAVQWNDPDTPDENFPFYPFVVWSRNFETEFLNRKGYDITLNIPDLFTDFGDESSKVKQDYFEVCYALYEEAYMDSLADFCKENNLKFSGHLLGEEGLDFHVMDEINTIKLLEKMDYPGIDVLTCNPDNLKSKHLLLKTGSSAAYLNGSSVVMSETGFHSDPKDERDPKKILSSLLLQYANGVNTITSYMSIIYEKDMYLYVFDRLAKAGQLLSDGEWVLPLWVYYPVKSCYGYHLPSTAEQGHFKYYNHNFKLICNRLREALAGFEANYIDYRLIDNDAFLSICKGGHFLSDKTVPYLYIPACNFEVEGIAESLSSLNQMGVTIFAEQSPLLADEVRNLPFVRVVESADMAAKIIKSEGNADIEICGASDDKIRCCHKKGEKDVYMFVNISGEEVEFTATLKEKSQPEIYDLTDQKQVTYPFSVQNEKETISITLPPYGASIAVFK